MESHAAIAIKITNVYSLLLSNFIISKNYLTNKLHLKRNVFEVITVTVFNYTPISYWEHIVHLGNGMLCCYEKERGSTQHCCAKTSKMCYK